MQSSGYVSFDFGGSAINRGTKRTLRILQIPYGDYTASSLRTVLQDVLKNGAFQGSDPEGS